MATIEVVIFFISFSIFFNLPYKVASVELNSCATAGSGPEIQFPFWLKPCQQTSRCGYPGFDVSCNNQSQKILHLPYDGDFTLQHIDYSFQSIWINDPNNCLPKRLLKGFNLTNSPFFSYNLRNYTFLNCSYDPTGALFTKISCLSGENYSVVGVPSRYVSESFFSSSECSVISSVLVPRSWSSSSDLTGDLLLAWSEPVCGPCIGDGGVCGFKSDSSLEVECTIRPSHGLPRSAKYGIIIGVGIPGLLCLFGVGCYVCSKIRTHGRQPHPNIVLSTSIAPQSIVLVGLDGPTIESFPKTVLGESKRLPKLDDGTCPICLSEYQPKDTLRTIPACNHYFHVECIDEWLKMNATCPLCRNSPPDGSSAVTPCSSAPFSSSSRSSP